MNNHSYVDIEEGTMHKYSLENLGCANCAAKMEQKINALPGIEHASITYATKQLQLTAKNCDSLLPQIQDICSSIESNVKVVPLASTTAKANDDEEENEGNPLPFIIAGLVLFILGEILSHVGVSDIVTKGIFLVAYIILGGQIVLSAARNVLKGNIFDENFLMSIATIGALAIGDFAEAVGVMLFFRVGEYFEDKAVEKSRSQIMEAVDMRPEVVNLVEGADVNEIPAGDAKLGDIIMIRPGDRIPLDGTITEGESQIDTSPVTGEPVPVKVSVGSEVISGCINTSGQLKIKVEKVLADSMVTRILNSVENAAANKPQIERFITRFARIYTPIVVSIAILVAIVPSLITGNWRHWIYTALTFLVMSCPCALVLSVPLAFFSGIGVGSKKGILFKGGAALEALKDIKAVVMDKTGTVTKGNFIIQKVVPMDGFNEKQLLELAASCEQHSTHPIAVSIVSEAKAKGIQSVAPSSLDEISGHGIHAILPQGEVLCGNMKLMEQYKVDASAYEKIAFGSEVLLAVNGKYAGSIIISDTLKDGAQEAVDRLKNYGVTTAMLTGDSADSAEAIAHAVGIDKVYAKLLPQDKVDKLQSIRKEQGSVMFVGDGINDAPVLAGADVGAAMGSGADAAIEAADVVFMNSKVESIPTSIAIAKLTGRIALQNIILALAIKIAVMVLGLFGFANMWWAVFADTGVAFLCILNSIRILYLKK